jgi:Ser/Thr protein kinase RdoA (MazF antagonist)
LKTPLHADERVQEVLSHYGLRASSVQAITSGLINNTWKAAAGGANYIVQKVNHQVFTKPFELADNICRLKSFLEERHPLYLFIAPVDTKEHTQLVALDDGYYRILPFVPDSHTIDVVSRPDQAYEAAKQFSLFTANLDGFDASTLHATIPRFHDLAWRYEQFETALSNGNGARIAEAAPLIREIQTYEDVLSDYLRIVQKEIIKPRVTHHDTKISNVLFDRQSKGICVIDLDTVMSGMFISDLGDMMRTYLSPASEEVTDLGAIEVREEYFQAIIEGYMEHMHDHLTDDERKCVLYSGYFLLYMQALRFLTDYLNNDAYYGARYDNHNYVRTANQLTLLKRFHEKRKLLTDIIRKV